MTATKIQPGDDTHLTLLMAPHSLNFVTGADRAALLAYGREVFAAGREAKCLAQIQEPEAPAAVAPQGVEPQALAESIRELEAWEARADDGELTTSECEAVMLVLHELKRMRSQQLAADGLEQFERLDVQNHQLRRAMQRVMARLTNLLDEDQFADIESIVSAAGVTPPAPALEAPAAPGMPAPQFDLRTSAGGRGYVAWHFANVLKRHDFHSYIHNTLAADFACALARALETPDAQGATDDAIDAIVLRQTGFDGDGYQAMTADELRRIVRSALGGLAAAPQAPSGVLGWVHPQWAVEQGRGRIYGHNPGGYVAVQIAAPQAPAKGLPYEPTSDMLNAGRACDPALPVDTVRAIWWAMWRTAPQAPAAPALPEQLQTAEGVHRAMLRGILPKITMLQCAHTHGEDVVTAYRAANDALAGSLPNAAPAAPAEAVALDMDRVLALADEHADESRDDGMRLLDRGGLLALAQDVLRMFSPVSAPAAPAAIPPNAITASLMRDDGGEAPAFCLMVAYQSESDARAALSLLSAAPAAPAVDAQGERDAAFEAVRQRLCRIPRWSFHIDSRGNLRRVDDARGNWIEFSAAHELFDPVAVDSALAAQAKEGGAAA